MVGIDILVQLWRCAANWGCGKCSVISVFTPAPIIELFSTSPSSNQVFLSQGSPKRIIKSGEKNYDASSYFPTGKGTPLDWLFNFVFYIIFLFTEVPSIRDGALTLLESLSCGSYILNLKQSH
jgi:hypothetical protein